MESGVIEDCTVLAGEQPKWTTTTDPKRDQVIYRGRTGNGRHERYSLVRWDGNKTTVPSWWFECLGTDRLAEARAFFREGKVLRHPDLGAIVLVEHQRDFDKAVVRRVHQPWFFLGRWYRVHRRLLVLRDWLQFNRTWLQQNW